jgi:phosphatidate cytidylyltransferase
MMDLAVKPNVLWAVAGLFSLLLLATLIVFVLGRANPAKNYAELRQRVNSWWVMVLMFTLAMVLSRTLSLAFFGFMSFLALKEYLSLIPTRRADRRVLFWAYLTIPLQYYWVAIGWYGMFIIFIPVYMFLFLPMRMVLVGETKDFLHAAGTLHWGLMATVFSVSHLAFLLALPDSGNPAGGGAGLVLFLVFLTEFNDVAQYVWGKSFGRHKIVPKVSPNKTWEGFLGGVFTSVVCAWVLAPVLTPLSLVHSLALGVIIPVAGFTGDVVISALKRDIGVKDSGSLLPGHGGILDRIDSLTYTAPLFFHFVRYFYF